MKFNKSGLFFKPTFPRYHTLPCDLLQLQIFRVTTMFSELEFILFISCIETDYYFIFNKN